jgi:hypothetical protein
MNPVGFSGASAHIGPPPRSVRILPRERMRLRVDTVDLTELQHVAGLTPRGISAQKYTGFPTLFLKIAEKTCERRDPL